MKKWAEIEGFEGRYVVSNYGSIMSIPRYAKVRGGGKRTTLAKIMKLRTNRYGYKTVMLFSSEGNRINKLVHLLVWDAFGVSPRNGRILQVDHVNEDKTDNRFANMQLLSNRENCLKGKQKHKTTSKYPGVYFHKNRNKFMAQIQINGKKKGLGYYEKEEDAFDAYKNACLNSEIKLKWREWENQVDKILEENIWSTKLKRQK